MKPTGPQGTPYHMNPDVPHIKNPKPVANDLLRELLTAPGGLDKMNQQQQYGKLVEMRQRQAMIDRSDGAMREYQRVTQSLTDQQREAIAGRGPEQADRRARLQPCVALAPAAARCPGVHRITQSPVDLSAPSFS